MARLGGLPSQRSSPPSGPGTGTGYPWVDGDWLYAADLNAAIAAAGQTVTDWLPAGQPDGVTDLTVYMQQAIDAAAGHFTLVIPANVNPYIITTALIIPSNTHLIIEAGATIKVADGANQGALVLAAFATHVTIELYGTLDGNLINQEPYSSALVTPLHGVSGGISGGVGNTSVSNVYIIGGRQGLVTSFKNWGFNLVSAINCEVNGVTFRDCGNTAAYAGITSRTAVVAGSSYVNSSRVLTLQTDPGVAASGIAVGDVFTYVAGTDAGIGSYAGFLSGEYVAAAGTSDSTIIAVVPPGALDTEVGSCAIQDGRVGKAVKCRNVGFINCVFDNIRDVGSGFYGGVVGGYIRGCEFSNHAGPAIFSDPSQPGVNEDCEIISCYAHDGAYGPAVISNAGNIRQRNCRVVNNTVCNNVAGGILATACNGVEIYGNTVHNNYPAIYNPTQISGQINVGTSATRVSVWGNTVRDPGQSVTNQLVSHFIVPASGSVTPPTYNSTTGAVVWTMSAAHQIAVGEQFYVNNTTGTGDFARLNGWQTATAGTTGAVLCFTAATGLTLTLFQGAARSFTFAVASCNLVAGTYTSDAAGNISLLTVQDHGLLVGDAFVMTGVAGTAGSAVAFNNLNGQFTATANTGVTTTKTLNFVTTPSLTIPIASGRVLPANYGIAITNPDYCRISGNRIGDYQTTRQMTACIGGVWGLNGASDSNYFGPRNATDPDVSSYALGSISGLSYDLVTSVLLGNLNVDGQVTFRGNTGASSAPAGYFQPRGLTPGWNYHAGRGEVDFLLGEGTGTPGGFDFLQVTVIKPTSLVSYDPATGIVSLTTDRAHTIQPGGAFVITLSGTDNNGGFDVFRMSGGYTAMTGTTGTTLIYTTAHALSVLTITGGTVTPSGTGGGLIKTEVGLNGSLLSNDGWGNTQLGGALVHGKMQTVASLANAGTVTVNQHTSMVLIRNSASIATATIVMPAVAAGQYTTGSELELNFQNPIGALTWSPAISGAPTTITQAGASANFINSGTVWLRRIAI
jgi:parallel beta-helix repeat protein